MVVQIHRKTMSLPINRDHTIRDMTQEEKKTMRDRGIKWKDRKKENVGEKGEQKRMEERKEERKERRKGQMEKGQEGGKIEE